MMIQVVTIAPFITQTFFIVSLWEPTRVFLRDDTQLRFDAMLGAPNKIENKAELAESIETSAGKLLSTTTSTSNDKQQIIYKQETTNNQPTNLPTNQSTDEQPQTQPQSQHQRQHHSHSHSNHNYNYNQAKSKQLAASTCTRTSTPSSKPLFHYKLSTKNQKTIKGISYLCWRCLLVSDN